ncbi:MAG: hypothetical protein GY864_02590 [Desulfobacterales bacterium]|nr:hypothetical protein [Desulfobacterales bacterium]
MFEAETSEEEAPPSVYNILKTKATENPDKVCIIGMERSLATANYLKEQVALARKAVIEVECKYG